MFQIKEKNLLTPNIKDLFYLLPIVHKLGKLYFQLLLSACFLKNLHKKFLFDFTLELNVHIQHQNLRK